MPSSILDLLESNQACSQLGVCCVQEVTLQVRPQWHSLGCLVPSRGAAGCQHSCHQRPDRHACPHSAGAARVPDGKLPAQQSAPAPHGLSGRTALPGPPPTHSMSEAPCMPAIQQHAKPEMQAAYSYLVSSKIGHNAPVGTQGDPQSSSGAMDNRRKRGTVTVGSAPPEASAPNPGSNPSMKTLPRALAPDALLHLHRLGIAAGGCRLRCA